MRCTYNRCVWYAVGESSLYLNNEPSRRTSSLNLGTLSVRVFALCSSLLLSPAVVPSFGTHQLSNVEKRHHELGAQRNALFDEMRELLKQQQDEVAACRAALAKTEQAMAQVGGGGEGENPASEGTAACAASLSLAPAASPRPRDTIATIAGAGRAAGRSTDGAASREGAEGDTAIMEEADAADFANYFYSYAELDHQKQMLEDDRRMEAYRNSMLQNKNAFHGKTVLDVGSGSGVLAIFAAQAGAKKASGNLTCPPSVYAVEYTDMAKHARTLVEKNGYGEVIEVIQGSVESIVLPEKVDIIVSEWMGYFLLRESMLDSVVVARDKWLKDTGLMFPSHASMVWAPVDDRNEKLRRENDYKEYVRVALSSWSEFSEQAMKKYGVDMSGLDKAYDEECAGFFSLSSLWRELSGRQVVSEPKTVKELDLHTCSLEDTKGLKETPFSFPLRNGAPPVTGFAGWFDVSFRGRDEVAPLDRPVEFSTAPAAGYTHWGQQQVFYLEKPVIAARDATVEGTVAMVRQANNPRLYNVKVEHRLSFAGGEADSRNVSNVYKLS
ncbi:unnamed protein product [Scytosiphon promiscuus]